MAMLLNEGYITGGQAWNAIDCVVEQGSQNGASFNNRKEGGIRWDYSVF